MKGENNADVQFGCCERRTVGLGNSAHKYHLSRNIGAKYAEANANYGLLNYRFKLKSASDGYSFMVAFESILPEDLSIETFARLQVRGHFLSIGRIPLAFFSNNFAWELFCMTIFSGIFLVV